MADINIQGIDKSTGRMRPVAPGDVVVDTQDAVFIGTSGIIGQSGLSGATGINGLQGATGALGASGLIGASGIRGVTGLTLAGHTGIQGSTGVVIGTTGTQGVTGSQGFGSFALLTGATTITTAVIMVACDTTAGPFSVTVPLGGTAGPGKEYVFYDHKGTIGTNNLTILPSGADTFNNVLTSFVMTTNWEVTKMYSDGFNYYLRSAQGPTGIQGATGVAVQGSTGLQGATGV